MGNAGEDSRERIMGATYRALIETGYADLTMSDIAEESDVSTSLLHYHFDTKEDLLVAFLDHVIESLIDRFAASADRTPTERLYEILSLYVLSPAETERQSFHIALVELRSQAPYNERYRERFRRFDELITEVLIEVLQDGIANGSFRTGDEAELATLLVATVDGARTRAIALGDLAYTQAVLDALYEHLLEDVLTGDAREQWAELTVE